MTKMAEAGFCIETQGLTKAFPIIRNYCDFLLHPFKKKEHIALRDISLEVSKGEIFGLLGPNGAGKTTLIKILATLVFPTSGKAFVNGLDVTQEGKKIRAKTGYVMSDERSFYWRLTGRQNMIFFGTLNNIPGKKLHARINSILELLDFSADADRMFKDYSTGTRQKMAIARGLLTDPDIIYMDEPTRALDPIIAAELKRLIKERLAADGKRTVIIATHNLNEAEELCDRIAVLKKGEVRYTGPIASLKKEFGQGRDGDGPSLEKAFAEIILK